MTHRSIDLFTIRRFEVLIPTRNQKSKVPTDVLTRVEFSFRMNLH
jgi:hypothetical protein